MAATGSIRVDKGQIELEVNDQGETIAFVADTAFMERFDEVRHEIMQLSKDLQERENKIIAGDPEAWAELKTRAEKEENEEEVEGPPVIPSNYSDRIQLEKELVQHSYAMLDKCFGADCSRKVFGEAQELDLVIDFLEQVTPFIRAKRKEKLDKYRKSEK